VLLLLLRHGAASSNVAAVLEAWRRYNLSWAGPYQACSMRQHPVTAVGGMQITKGTPAYVHKLKGHTHALAAVHLSNLL
jgi:bisphosphoglycerate-dependent phosphoglycerate mutase